MENNLKELAFNYQIATRLQNFVFKSESNNAILRFRQCPKCGGKNHFMVYLTTNTYSSYTKCCRGGDSINFLVEIEGYSTRAAIELIKSNKTEILVKPYKPRDFTNIYNRLIKGYKKYNILFDSAKNDPDIRTIFKQNLDFFDKYTEIFINNDKKNKESDNYLFGIEKNIEKLYKKEVLNELERFQNWIN